MTPDEPVVIQSERQQEHLRVAEQLVHEQKAYYCYCTPEELQRRIAQTTVNGVTYSRYDGFCKKFIGQKLDKPFVIRFAVPADCTQVVVDDAIKGQITFSSDAFDDFILVRSDGAPMYNFVVASPILSVAKSILLIPQSRYYSIKLVGTRCQLLAICP
jgi:glutamyl-tRNA synthetase